MRSTANPEFTKMMLRYFKPDTPQVFVVDADSAKSFGTSDLLATSVNGYVLVTPEKGDRQIINCDDVTKYILFSKTAIPLLDEEKDKNFYTVFVLTRKLGCDYTLTTASYHGDALAVSCKYEERYDGLTAVGNGAIYVGNYKLYPHYTLARNPKTGEILKHPQTGQPQTYVHYYNFVDMLNIHWEDDYVDVTKKTKEEASNSSTPSS